MDETDLTRCLNLLELELKKNKTDAGATEQRFFPHKTSLAKDKRWPFNWTADMFYCHEVTRGIKIN